MKLQGEKITANSDGKYYSGSHTNKEKDILLSISKIFFIAFLLYYGWFQRVFFSISNMSFLLGAGMILFIIYHSLKQKTPILRGITVELVIWLMFAFASLGTGYLVAVSKSLVIKSLMNYFEYLVMIFGMAYISYQDKEINFFSSAYSVFSLVCALTTVFSGVNYTSTRVSMSASTNPNTLGIIMVIGIFCLLFNLDSSSPISLMFMICELFLFLYVVILTGSRKSLISAIIVIVLWIVFVRKSFWSNSKKISIGGRIAVLLFSLIGAFLIYKFASNSYILLRLGKLFESGDDTRVSMYLAAFELFKMSPFVGVGLDNYRTLTIFSTYSHSTYAEVLACTGIIGTILYFIPYCLIAAKIKKLVRCSNTQISSNAKLLGILFFMLLFLGTGVIHFYDVNSYLSLGFIIAYCNLNFKVSSCVEGKNRNENY